MLNDLQAIIANAETFDGVPVLPATNNDDLRIAKIGTPCQSCLDEGALCSACEDDDDYCEHCGRYFTKCLCYLEQVCYP